MSFVVSFELSTLHIIRPATVKNDAIDCGVPNNTVYSRKVFDNVRLLITPVRALGTSEHSVLAALVLQMADKGRLYRVRLVASRTFEVLGPEEEH